MPLGSYYFLLLLLLIIIASKIIKILNWIELTLTLYLTKRIIMRLGRHAVDFKRIVMHVRVVIKRIIMRKIMHRGLFQTHRNAPRWNWRQIFIRPNWRVQSRRFERGEEELSRGSYNLNFGRVFNVGTSEYEGSNHLKFDTNQCESNNNCNNVRVPRMRNDYGVFAYCRLLRIIRSPLMITAHNS